MSLSENQKNFGSRTNIGCTATIGVRFLEALYVWVAYNALRPAGWEHLAYIPAVCLVLLFHIAIHAIRGDDTVKVD